MKLKTYRRKNAVQLHCTIAEWIEIQNAMLLLNRLVTREKRPLVYDISEKIGTGKLDLA